jgi:hypothetical protein
MSGDLNTEKYQVVQHVCHELTAAVQLATDGFSYTQCVGLIDNSICQYWLHVPFRRLPHACSDSKMLLVLQCTPSFQTVDIVCLGQIDIIG